MVNGKIAVLDGNSLMNRAFYALPPMNNSKGLQTNAIYGFTMMLFKIIEDINPSHIAVAFDRKAPTFRHLEYKDYKAGRKKMPVELFEQFEPVKELLKAFNAGIFEIDGYEADDIIGTISRKYQSTNCEVIIYTGDKDALQLVTEYTKVMITKKGITDIDIYDTNLIKEKYNFTPDKIIDLKGLMGDSSDNIPGVAGIGEKTALKLLSEYGSLENVYENIENISGKKVKENLITYKADAFLSKSLATINTEVPIDLSIDPHDSDTFDIKKINELFDLFEFKSLKEKFKPKEAPHSFEELKLFTEDSKIIENIKLKKRFNFILFNEGEETSLIIENDYIVPEDKIELFKDIFEDANIEKFTFGGKKTFSFLYKKGINLSNLSFDIEIAAYLLNPTLSSYDLDVILSTYSEVTVSNITKDEYKELAALFVNHFDKVIENMHKAFEGYGMLKLYDDVELPLVKVLSAMELEGFKVNSDTLKEIGVELSADIEEKTTKIYELAGETFNINSPKQLGVILFEKLELPVIKKTKTGYSTDAEVLEELSDKHEIVDLLLNYRQLAKLRSTYIDGLLACISKDSRIHSSFNQTVTATGRISSTEPNLQNIPIKMEQGRRIRKAFVPTSEEFVILSADYSQIELRVLAHISNDPSFVEAFNKNQDIHTRTASEVFEIPMDEVTKLQRSRAKAVNFGIVYGLSDYGLSRDLKITRKEAKKYIDNYFSRYQGVKNYLDAAVEECRETGSVKTLMNRIRIIPEINATNRNVKMFGERLAMNTPIQGTAADIIKIAMVKVYNRLLDERLKSKLILQVHDELVLEVHKSELDYVIDLVKGEMENAIELSVPMQVDINIGNNWYEAK